MGRAPSRAQQVVKKDDILFATVRPYLKNISTVPEEYENSIASSGFCVIRPFVVNPRFIFNYVLSQLFIDSVNKFAKGTSYPAVTNKIVLDQIIALPPLQEQHRIVSKIEELFSELDHAEENLIKSHHQLKTYWQVVLNYAFNGKLSKHWRKGNKAEPILRLLTRLKEKKEGVFQEELMNWELDLTQ